MLFLIKEYKEKIKRFNIKSQNKNNHNLALKDQSSSVFSSEVSVENNDNKNTDVLLLKKVLLLSNPLQTKILEQN